jgi:hypothetical protein
MTKVRLALSRWARLALCSSGLTLSGSENSALKPHGNVISFVHLGEVSKSERNVCKEGMAAV